MTIVEAIKRITQWVDQSVGQNILLKEPDDDYNTSTYRYKLVHPSAFAMLVPPRDKKKERDQVVTPSIAVQLLNGNENGSYTGTVDIRFELITWDPGIHGQDLFIPKNPEEEVAYVQMETEEAQAYYKRTVSGWEEHWNLVDLLIQNLRELEGLEGLKLDSTSGIQYGQNTEADMPINYYPYWVSWVTCSFLYGVTKKQNERNDLLD